jgi:hypothetical protein
MNNPPKVLTLGSDGRYRGRRDDWEAVAAHLEWSGITMAARAIREYVAAQPKPRIRAGRQRIAIPFRQPELIKLGRYCK